MEELKLLVEMVASLPQMALWVILAFFVYKLSILASIYGVIRFVVAKLHDWAIIKKTEPQVLYKWGKDLDAITIRDCEDALLMQLRRIRRATGNYIHPSDVEWLRSAIDEKIRKEEMAQVPKAV